MIIQGDVGLIWFGGFREEFYVKSYLTEEPI
jgi:hypothetical protein